jgi:signal transduction histidine kinase
MCDTGITDISINDHIAGLASELTRSASAQAIAAMARADALLVFIRDREIEAYLPAPGFPQTLPNGKAWQNFIRQCFSGIELGKVPFPSKNDLATAAAITWKDEAVAIFVGAEPPAYVREEIQKILPLLSAVMHREQEAITYKSLASTATKAAEKAEKLMIALDAVKDDLRKALVEQEKDKEAIKELAVKKDEFMNIASHELKTPITSMKAYIQMIGSMMQGKEHAPILSYVEKANKQVDKLVGLVNDLLDVSKVQAGHMQFQFSKFNLSEIIAECVEQMQNSTAGHRIIIEGDRYIEVIGDRMRLEQVISNLLSNAIKYSPKADKVIIRTMKADNELKVEVQDFGIGIPQEHIERIFDRFYRVDQVAGKFFGLGLGLYITAEIIKRHNGRIGVKSEAGQGSLFWFTIPLAAT